MNSTSKAMIFASAMLLCAACASEANENEASSAEPQAAEEPSNVDRGAVIDLTVETLSGDELDLGQFRGKPMLIVNTASNCGYTPQYAKLQELHEKYEEAGLVVVGFPSNDFGGQEPGSAEEIATFCKRNYGVTFPMMAKVHAKGPEIAPIYEALTQRSPEQFRGDVRWNFTKFLVDAEGYVVARFESAVDPLSSEVIDRVEAMLN